MIFCKVIFFWSFSMLANVKNNKRNASNTKNKSWCVFFVANHHKIQSNSYIFKASAILKQKLRLKKANDRLQQHLIPCGNLWLFFFIRRFLWKWPYFWLSIKYITVTKPNKINSFRKKIIEDESSGQFFHLTIFHFNWGKAHQAALKLQFFACF